MNGARSGATSLANARRSKPHLSLGLLTSHAPSLGAAGPIVALGYTIYFRANPPMATSIGAVHARNAQRIFDLLCTTGGLKDRPGHCHAERRAAARVPEVVPTDVR